jgi:hypothetical protein
MPAGRPPGVETPRTLLVKGLKQVLTVQQQAITLLQSQIGMIKQDLEAPGIAFDKRLAACDALADIVDTLTNNLQRVGKLGLDAEREEPASEAGVDVIRELMGGRE